MNVKPFINLIILVCFVSQVVFAQTATPLLSETTYVVSPVDRSLVSGQVFLGDYGSGKTVIVISLSGTPVNGVHPAHLHEGDCGSNGTIAVPLESVKGSTGLSVTVNDVPLDAITTGDHYLNIHASSDDMATIVACAEVGLNASSGEMTQMDTSTETMTDAPATGVRPEEFETLSTASYRIFSVGASQIFGQVQMTEEASGGTKFVLTLEGHDPQTQYPVDVKEGDCGPDGSVLLQLNAFPLGIIEPNASMTFTDLPIEQFSEADNYLTVYDKEGFVLACGEIGIGANR